MIEKRWVVCYPRRARGTRRSWATSALVVWMQAEAALNTPWCTWVFRDNVVSYLRRKGYRRISREFMEAERWART